MDQVNRKKHDSSEAESLNGEEASKKENYRETEKDKRRYNLGICLFSVLNVLLISLIVITAYYVFSEKKVIVLHDVDICVPCEDLRLHPDDTIEGIERRGENKTTCCVAEKENSDVIVGYFIDHWLKKKLANGNRKFIRYKCDDSAENKPIIKLVGKTEKQKAEHHKLQWDGDHDMAIVLNDTRITHHKEHGFIEIKKSGLYQVYSQIVLDHDMNSHNPYHAPAIYQHSIILIEAGTVYEKSPREKILMKTSNSHCESTSNKHTITSYLGGAFQLSEGDKLAVKAHNKTEIRLDPHMNFFGAHML